ncbi:hypothetical protein OKJ48_33535 [Streptomyces kunmingensis]|uniref:Uncharacterized protein n=1 Tax=Streptomyces kunmingensis TaxID=68225 RepID=A0ABU6CK78_9ACTN|nr:hypothetical protein [Streptomyces kunmingensis]MEB3965113.1 hypothetical protein [Streptomyces kunmingensis]
MNTQELGKESEELGEEPDGRQAALGGVHLLGSVPLADSADVFRTVSRSVGPYVRRIPDGETGDPTL